MGSSGVGSCGVSSPDVTGAAGGGVFATGSGVDEPHGSTIMTYMSMIQGRKMMPSIAHR